METLSYSWAVLKRIINIFAVAPAVAGLMFFGLAYQFSFKAAALDVYSHIEQLAQLGQDAPHGYLMVRECAERPAPAEPNAALPALKACESYDVRRVSVDALADNAAVALSSVYWMLVLFGFAINLLIIGPRRFFLMDETPANASEATPGSSR